MGASPVLSIFFPEIFPKPDDPVHPPLDHGLFRRLHVRHDDRYKVSGLPKSGQKIRGLIALMFHHDCDGDMFGVKGHAVSKEEKQYHGEHKGDGDARRIPYDLIAFLSDQPFKPHDIDAVANTVLLGNFHVRAAAFSS